MVFASPFPVIVKSSFISRSPLLAVLSSPVRDSCIGVPLVPAAKSIVSAPGFEFAAITAERKEQLPTAQEFGFGSSLRVTVNVIAARGTIMAGADRPLLITTS